MEQNPKQTAYHEAGHAVVDQLCGHVPIAVDLHRKDGRLGASAPGYGWDDTESARTYLVSLFAGYAAEIESGADEAIARAGASSDFEAATPVIEALGEGDEAYWIGKAQQFVRQHWRAVEAVAEELLRHERLTGDEIEIIVAHAEGDEEADIDAYRALRNTMQGD